MPRRVKELLWLLAVAAAYFVAGKLALRLAFVHESATAVWPPTGIALAALMLRGRRAAPAVFVGAFLVNQTTAGSTLSSLGIATGNLLEALLGAWLVQRYAGGAHAFERPRTVARFALAAGLLGTAVSATIGVASLVGLGFAASASARLIWLTWFLGDLGGALVVTPVLVLWAQQPRWGHGRLALLEAGAIAVVLAASGWLVFGPVLPPVARGVPVAVACLPPLVWAALRFGPRETATGTLLACGVAVAGTLRGLGPYGLEPPHVSLLLLQGYAVITGIVVLALAAAVFQQEAAHRSLHDRDAQALAEAQAVAHIGSWTWDITTNQVSWSDELFLVFGRPPGSAGIDYDAFLSAVHVADRSRVDQTVRRSFATGDPFFFDHRIVRPDGAERWVHGRGRVVMGAEGPLRMVGTCQDITDRRRAEEASRAFLANAAHELRTPLTSVLGLSDLISGLGRTLNQPLLEEYCEMLRKQGLRARRLISGLLDVSRMEQGLLEVRLERVVLNDLVHRAADAVPRADDRRLEIDVPETLAAQADPLRMEEVLVNLLQNAYLYGGPCVGLQGFESGGQVHLRVWDDGDGVPADLLPHLFQPFARAQSARTQEGSGLGLTIVHGLVQAQNGRVWYEPRQPRGAQFVVCLPRVSDETVASRSAGAPTRVG
jgi:signal transduction histidine kinase